MSSEEKSVKEEVVGSPMPEVTRHHILFLRARGYLVETLDAARKFIAGIEPENLAGFFADAAAWQEPCVCGCCREIDNGACPKFEEGANGRCVYCDHALPCHERDKDNQFFNVPLGVGERMSDGTIVEHVSELIRDEQTSKPEPGCEMCGGSALGGRKVPSGEVDDVESYTHYCATCWKKSGG